MKQVYARICVLFFAVFVLTTAGKTQVTLTISSSTNISCNGGNNGTAVATPTGVGPYSFLWSPSGITNDTATGLIATTYTCTVTDSSDMSTATATVTITQPTALSATYTAINVPCYGNNNGSATVIPAGGTAPYLYQWTPTGGTQATANNLYAGIYTCTITDAHGCASPVTVYITQPTQLTVGITSTNSNCNCNGTATGQITGGTPVYTFAWSPAGGNTAVINNLCAGNYTLTVTDMNGCTAVGSTAINQTPPVTIAFSHTNTLCSTACTGTATGVPSGGQSPYTYSWSVVNQTTQTATGLCPMTYTLTVTDAAGCTGVGIVTITSPPPLTQTTTANSGCSACSGNATITPSGGTSPYSYSWTPNVSSTSSATALCSGGYSVAITDNNGCPLTTTFSITNSTLSVSTSTIPVSSCLVNGQASVSILSGTAPYTYLWMPGNITTATIGNIPAGTYSVTVTDACGNIANSTATVTQLPPLLATTTTAHLLCYNATGTAVVTPSGGTPPYNYLWQNINATTSTVTNLYPGIYHVIVGDSNGCFISVYDSILAPGFVGGYTTATQTNCTSVNGMAVVHPFGGTPPYTYLWSSNSTNDTAFGLAGGNYSVNIIDAYGCVGYAAGTIYTACDNIVLGKVYSDPNLNCTYDAGDSALNRYVYTYPGFYGAYTNAQGDYSIRVPAPGTYSVYISNAYSNSSPSYMSHCPASGVYTVNFPNIGDTVFSRDFAQHVLTDQDITTWLYSGVMRPGFPVTYTLAYTNSGNAAVNNCILTFNHDLHLTYNSASLTPTSYTSPTATWNLGTLVPGQTGIIYVTLTVSPTAGLNSYLCSNTNIMPVIGDDAPGNNYATECHIVQGSLDPNIKTINSPGLNPVAATIPLTDTTLTYTIYFQNTGTDTAFNIVVVDTLSPNLNLHSIEPGLSSDPYVFEMANGVMKFNFYNIQLPDSNRNEPESHAWVSYKINTKPQIAPGDVINNTAGIYFDYNTPVFTNTTSDTMIFNNPLAIHENNSEQISVYPNPFDESTTLVLPPSVSGKQNEIVLTDPEGRVVKREFVSGANTFTIQRGNLEAGIYFCTVLSAGNVVGVTKVMVK